MQSFHYPMLGQMSGGWGVFFKSNSPVVLAFFSQGNPVSLLRVVNSSSGSAAGPHSPGQCIGFGEFYNLYGLAQGFPGRLSKASWHSLLFQLPSHDLRWPQEDLDTIRPTVSPCQLTSYAMEAPPCSLSCDLGCTEAKRSKENKRLNN